MTRSKILILFLVYSAFACVKGPLTVTKENRFPDTYWGGFSRRIVSGGGLVSDGKNLYFGTRRGTLNALDGVDGHRLWKKRLGGAIDSKPLISKGKIFVGNSEGHLFCLDVTSGKQLWTASLGGDVLGQPVANGEGTILVGANDGFLYALDVANGEQRWRYKRDLPDRITVQGFATPVVRENRIYAAFGDGTIAALRADDGVEQWSQQLKSESRFSDVVAPLLWSSGQVVTAQYYGTLFGIEPTGTIRFSLPDGGSSAATVGDGGVLYVPAAENQVIALDERTGDKKWTYKAPETATWSGAALWGPKLLVASYEGIFYVLDRPTGKFVWRYDLGAPIHGGPVVLGDNVWILTRKGTVFRMNGRK